MKIGDTVVTLERIGSSIPVGGRGTIVSIAYDDGFVSVDWDNMQNGHDCGGAARMGHGWNVQFHTLQVIKTGDGKFVNPF